MATQNLLFTFKLPGNYDQIIDIDQQDKWQNGILSDDIDPNIMFRITHNGVVLTVRG